MTSGVRSYGSDGLGFRVYSVLGSAGFCVGTGGFASLGGVAGLRRSLVTLVA